MNAPKLLTTTAALLLIAGAAHAQAPAAAAPTLTPPTGAPIPGICIFSIEATIGNSTVGKAYQARMQQLEAQVQAELQPEGATIQSDATALQGQQASLAADVFQQRANAMNQRIQVYQAKADLRQQELQATQQKNLGRIAQEVQPLLVNVYNARKCAAVFTSEGLISANPAMDISADVTTQLNQKMTTISFDREHLDQPAAARPAAAPAARPAAPAAPARPATPAPAPRR
ncbi:MAG TPA: OmpH family outer membrane protein [Caulobacteraceae bacterium]|jgi:outer membrane protein|nr:OmpH family outer membrane protein [Caulobacteraceae bacterium]